MGVPPRAVNTLPILNLASAKESVRLVYVLSYMQDGHKMCQLVQDSTECKTCGTDRPLLLHLLLATGDDGSPVCPRSEKY